MIIGIPREIFSGEKRVACSPDNVDRLKKLGYSLLIESQAGMPAGFSDQDYVSAGAEIAATATDVWQRAEIILKVRPVSEGEAELSRSQQWVIGFFTPAQNIELLKKLASKKVNAIAMEAVPRISRAQKLDALSSMANIAGYRAVIEAAHHFGRFFTGQITAAGKVPPAKVLVIGAGVAGLSAIGTASSLGAIVRGFDTRPEVKDQVKSMGGEFLELNFKEDGATEGGYAKQMSPEFIKAEMDLFAQQAKEVDIIITTALIPGKPAPKLITSEMVRSMRTGSVIVDLAAEQGGNCEETVPGQVVVKNGVTIIGYTDLPSRLAKQASQLYSQNLWRLMEELTPEKNGELKLNLQDEMLRAATVVHDGEVLWPPPPIKVSVQPKAAAPAPAQVKVASEKEKASAPWWPMIAAAVVLLVVGQFAPARFMAQMTVFVLSCFVGYMVVWNVKASLHTPLMSVTNAISGIIAVGALLQISSENQAVQILAGIAILVAAINIFGGFLVTQRMLKMFRK